MLDTGSFRSIIFLMTDLERTVRQAIALIRAVPPDRLTITEINVVEMLEAALVKPAADPGVAA